MKLDSSFTVTAPIDRVWDTLMDFEQVAGCVPGAQVLSQLSEDAYQVAMKVKLGPVSMAYRGQMEVVERDAAAHRAVLKGQAKEARGQGTAQASAVLTLTADGGTTSGTVDADVQLSGRAAAMGGSVIGSVTDQMMVQFAENLQVMLNEAQDGTAADAADDAADGAAVTVSAQGEHVDTEVAASPHAKLEPEPESGPAAPRTTSAGAEGGDSLDGLTLAKGVVAGQLQDPQRVAQLVGVVAVVAYLLGKRSVRRDRDRWLALLTQARLD